MSDDVESYDHVTLTLAHAAAALRWFINPFSLALRLQKNEMLVLLNAQSFDDLDDWISHANSSEIDLPPDTVIRLGLFLHIWKSAYQVTPNESNVGIWFCKTIANAPWDGRSTKQLLLECGLIT